MDKIQLMSDSEKEIMKIIWDNGGSIFISELLKKIQDNNKDWKRTTVRTFVTRLIKKGFITTERQGQISKYIAAVSESEYMSAQAVTFVNNVFGGNIKSLLSSLFGQDFINKEEKEELNDFWKEGRDKIK